MSETRNLTERLVETLDYPALTEDGRKWARANADDSIVCRVALTGYDSDWPASHVKTAIETVNARAAGR